MRCMRCKCRMEPLHLSAPSRQVPGIVIIWSGWIQSVLLDVTECGSIVLTGELYSNIPSGLTGSDGAGWKMCAAASQGSEMWSTITFPGIHFSSRRNTSNLSLPLHPCYICTWFTRVSQKYQVFPRSFFRLHLFYTVISEAHTQFSFLQSSSELLFDLLSPLFAWITMYCKPLNDKMKMYVNMRNCLYKSTPECASAFRNRMESFHSAPLFPAATLRFHFSDEVVENYHKTQFV